MRGGRAATGCAAAMLVLAVHAAGQAAGDAAANDVELSATWGRIAHSSHGRHEDEAYRDVLQPGPAVATKRYGWEAFAPLLPPDDAGEGDLYALPFDAVRLFLEQIQVGPRPGPEGPMAPLAFPGVHAVVLERSAERLDLLLRIHVEFELVPDKVVFMLSQIEGRLVVDPATRRVLAFDFATPVRTYNYDVHLRMTGFTMIDIGCLDQLSLRGGGDPPALDDARLDEARSALRRAFYPFARLDWMGLEDGLAASRSEGKPLHLVTIFGPLDDEGC